MMHLEKDDRRVLITKAKPCFFMSNCKMMNRHGICAYNHDVATGPTCPVQHIRQMLSQPAPRLLVLPSQQAQPRIVISPQQAQPQCVAISLPRQAQTPQQAQPPQQAQTTVSTVSNTDNDNDPLETASVDTSLFTIGSGKGRTRTGAPIKFRTGTGWDSSSSGTVVSSKTVVGSGTVVSTGSSTNCTPVKQNSAVLAIAKQLKVKAEIDSNAMDEKFHEIYDAHKNTIEELKDMLVRLEQEHIWTEERFTEMWAAKDEMASGLTDLVNLLENSQ